MNTAMNKKTEKWLAWVFGLLFATSLVIYAVGVCYIQTHLCEQIGPSIAMFGVVVGILACGVLTARALVTRTTLRWVGLAFALLAVTVLYFFVGVLALPGCSGV